MAMAVSFDTFSQWVDDALTEMRKMLVENNAAAELVKAHSRQGRLLPNSGEAAIREENA